MRKPLEGIMALTYTPLKEDYTLNEDAVRCEIDWVIHRRSNSGRHSWLRKNKAAIKNERR
jgi:hypothetical protein